MLLIQYSIICFALSLKEQYFKIQTIPSMFIDNVDIFAYMQQAKFVPGYRNWEISRNIHSIRSAFKKMITRSDEIPYKNSIRNITRKTFQEQWICSMLMLLREVNCPSK